jgi:hypothetical protein
MRFRGRWGPGLQRPGRHTHRAIRLVFELNAQVIEPRFTATRRNCEIDSRIIQHPIGLDHRGGRIEERAIKPYRTVEVLNCDMDVHAFRPASRNQGSRISDPARAGNKAAVRRREARSANPGTRRPESLAQTKPRRGGAFLCTPEMHPIGLFARRTWNAARNPEFA